VKIEEVNVRAMLFLAGVLCLSSCKEGKDTDLDGVTPEDMDTDTDTDADTDTDTDTDTDVDESLTLELRLDADTTVAGLALGYKVETVDATGAAEIVSGSALSSDSQADLAYSDADLTATIAGAHVITATYTVDDEDLTATANLTVDAGPVAVLSLLIDATEIPAGEALGFAVGGTDAYGNTIDATGATVTSASADVMVEADTATATLVGSYTLTADLDGITDDQDFDVVAADPATVEMAVDEDNYELRDTAEVTVTVYDAYGNLSDASWTITVDGDGATTVDEDEVTFDEEGAYTIVVTVDDTAVSASVDVIVDSSGPDIEIVNPRRGEWTRSTEYAISGSATDVLSGVGAVTVNDEAMDLDTGGEFTTDLTFELGINIVTTEATDLDAPEANTSDDVRSVLQADAFWDAETEMDEGIVARVNEGEGGLDELSRAAEGLLTDDALDDALVGTLADETYCVDLILETVCMGYEVTLTDATIGDADIDIDTKSGQIRVRMDVTDITLDLVFDSDIVSGVPATVTIDQVDGEARFDPSVGSDGQIDVGLDTLDLSVTGLDMDIDVELGIFDGALDAIVDASVGAAEDGIVEAIEEQLSESIPELIEDALRSLSLSTTLTFADANYILTAEPQRVDVEPGGIEIPMRTLVTPESEIAAFLADGPNGSPYAGYGKPSFLVSDGGIELGFSLDFFNQVFRAFWAGGMLDTEMTDEDLGLEMSTLALVLPGLTDLTMRTEAMLPMVAILNPDELSNDQVILQLGDLYVQIHDGPVTEDSLYMEIYVSGVAPAQIELSDDSTAFEIEIGEPTVYVDVTEGGTSPLSPDGAEAAFDVLLPAFLPDVTGALTAIPIPGIDGYSIDDMELLMLGTGGIKGYVGIAGDLSLD
jgi:hypothetical protein